MTGQVGLRLPVLVVLVLLALAPSAQAADETRLIVKRDPGLSAAERADVRADAGVRLAEMLPLPDAEVVTAPAADADAALRDLNADPDVRYAERDTVMRAFAPPAEVGPDAYRDHLWAFDNGPTTLTINSALLGGTADADIDATGALALSDADGEGVTVAVVDTGLDQSHADLLTGMAVNTSESGGRPGLDDDRNGWIDDWRGWDFVGNDKTAQDDNGHGTHVAGTISATRNNRIGVAGVAPGADVLPLKALGADGSGYVSRIAAAFDYAGRARIPIVSASLGGPADGNRLLADTIARYPNTLFVVAAGNDGSDNDALPTDPCNVTAANVVCVGASDAHDAPACFSNVGHASVDLFAPGAGIVSTVPGSQYGWMSGTSMATPHVAAVAALVLAEDAHLSTTDVKDRVLDGVDHKTGMASLSVSGGRLNALRALGGDPADSGGGDGAWNPCSTDRDGDGVPDRVDGCPDRSGTVNGCPAAAPAPVAAPAPAPTTPAPRPTAPVAPPASGSIAARPAVRSLKATATPSRCRRGKRCAKRVTAAVTASRGATVALTLEQKRCRKRRCTWARVATVRVTGAARAVTGTLGSPRGLKRGEYRVTAVATSGAGKSSVRRASVKVR
jgi:thermitase